MLARLDALDRQATTVGALINVTLDVSLADSTEITAEVTANGEPIFTGSLDTVDRFLSAVSRLLAIATDYAGDDPF
jgi:hypothetical protein